MNLEQLQKEIAEDEGCVHEIYLDHLGLPTFGIGHLVKETDPEYDQPVGTPVSEDRVDACFASDIQITLNDCNKLYPNYDDLPEEVQLIIANMMFNMGYPRMSGFKKMKEAVDSGDWVEASEQMKDSRWYNQVTNRADRLVNRMMVVNIV